MADVTITAANVLASTSATTRTGIAGATITAGQVLYKDASDSNKLKLADANGVAAARVVEGIALHGASSAQPMKYVVTDSQFIPGFTVVVGTTYILASDNPGAIAPAADAASGDYVTDLGIGTTITQLNLNITAAGAVKA
jgi:hypothetical protein